MNGLFTVGVGEPDGLVQNFNFMQMQQPPF